MDCNVIQLDLVGYHLAPDTLEDGQRDAIDEHLLSCGECLRAYLRLKRHLESGPRPSEKTRTRLRDAVAARHRARPERRAGSFLRRPIPLYQGFAAAAVVLLLAMLVPMLFRRTEGTAIVPSKSGARVDTSRLDAESLNLY